MIGIIENFRCLSNIENGEDVIQKQMHIKEKVFDISINIDNFSKSNLTQIQKADKKIKADYSLSVIEILSAINKSSGYVIESQNPARIILIGCLLLSDTIICGNDCSFWLL